MCAARAVTIAAVLKSSYRHIYFTGYRRYSDQNLQTHRGHIWIQLHLPTSASEFDIDKAEKPLELDGFRPKGEATEVERKWRDINGLGYKEPVHYLVCGENP